MGLELIIDYNNVNAIVQKWSVIHWLKLVWDFKSEISLQHLVISF
jgi:hypothetical protein